MLGPLLQYGGFYGTGFGDFLNQLDQIHFFSLVLPFILIFALVYAILLKVPLFKTGKEDKETNKGPVVVISLAIGLLALQLEFVPRFFQEIFPRLGVGLSILLVGMILFGVFLNFKDREGREKNLLNIVFLIIGAIIFLFVALSPFNTVGLGYYGGGYFWNQYGAVLLVLVAIVGAIIAITKSSSK